VNGAVADTSEWIEYLAMRPAAAFRQWLESGSIIVPVVVLTELTCGARSREEQFVIEDLLADLPMHECSFHHAARAGALRRTLRAEGISVSALDALVAQSALDCDAPLLTRDAVFWKIAAHTKLRIASALSA
jgi:predicted nucleic acid-binding protein